MDVPVGTDLYSKSELEQKTPHTMTVNMLKHCNHQRVELFICVPWRSCLRNWVHDEGRNRAAGKAHYQFTGHVITFSCNGGHTVAEEWSVDGHNH